MDIDRLIRTKRAVRSFTEAPISDADLTAILDAGRRAQSSKNTQPWTFVVVRDRETLRQLSRCGRYAGHLAGAAVGVALVGDRGAEAFDLGQAAANMQLAAHARGIGSCIASMWEPERAARILGIPAERSFETAISFGWPAPEERDRPATAGGRRPLAEVVRFERWTEEGSSEDRSHGPTGRGSSWPRRPGPRGTSRARQSCGLTTIRSTMATNTIPRTIRPGGPSG